MNQNEKHAQQRSSKAWEVLGDFTTTRERTLRLKFLLPGGRVSKEGAVRRG
jgi:hypothetical protein